MYLFLCFICQSWSWYWRIGFGPALERAGLGLDTASLDYKTANRPLHKHNMSGGDNS